MNIYVIDTSSIIELKNKYPKHIFPSVWQDIEGLCKKGRMIAPFEVFNEIKEGDDELVKWAKKFKNIFIKPDKKQTEKVKEILKEFPFLAKFEKEGTNADPWIIALAIVKNEETKGKLFSTDNYIVVTEETKTKPNKIPAVCKNYGIESSNIIELFEREGWEF